MTAPVKLDVFGKRMLVERERGSWRAYLIGTDGKRSPVNIAIPDSVGEDELAQYFDDIFHEAATPERPAVVRLS
jgi:acetoin utilization deacetylase AcuC-like enzyme